MGRKRGKEKASVAILITTVALLVALVSLRFPSLADAYKYPHPTPTRKPIYVPPSPPKKSPLPAPKKPLHYVPSTPPPKSGKHIRTKAPPPPYKPDDHLPSSIFTTSEIRIPRFKIPKIKLPPKVKVPKPKLPPSPKSPPPSKKKFPPPPKKKFPPTQY